MKIKLSFGAALLLFSLILSSNYNFAVIYVFCAAAHEIGHLLAAKLLGIKIRELSLDIAGARIMPNGEIMSYKKEFLLCAAGPFASFILSVFALAVYSLRHKNLSMAELVSVFENTVNGVDSALILIFAFSLLQAIVNLMPISSFDGARMLGSTLSFAFGERAGEALRRTITFTFTLIVWMASVYILLRVGQGLSLFSFSLCMFLKIFDDK